MGANGTLSSKRAGSIFNLLPYASPSEPSGTAKGTDGQSAAAKTEYATPCGVLSRNAQWWSRPVVTGVAEGIWGS